ncbi:hypothetical protein BU17DRAFT_71151 [Hysterangium stoloniferum]|nr:hypothetical protein BU17DRAFT_72803 [Hysterangium stoloniferum]KAF8507529.1 hypothetical protein BU17DRAFT_71151 [Hysterangium stoloniferum]
MVAEVHAGVQKDFYHGKARPQDVQEPKMDHHEMGLPSLEVEMGLPSLEVEIGLPSLEVEMGLHPLEVVGMVEKNVHGGQLERSFANAAYAPHLAPAGDGVQVFEGDP